jgi:hypothetical protein
MAARRVGGDLASSVTNRAILDANRCNVVAAIAKANYNPACAGCLPKVSGGVGAVSESDLLLKRLNSCSVVTATQARRLANSQLRGVPSSVRTQQIQQRTIEEYAPLTDPLRRFALYQGPVIPPACPPTPAEILNSTMPKPSTRCLAPLPFYLRPPG